MIKQVMLLDWRYSCCHSRLRLWCKCQMSHDVYCLKCLTVNDKNKVKKRQIKMDENLPRWIFWSAKISRPWLSFFTFSVFKFEFKIFLKMLSIGSPFLHRKNNFIDKKIIYDYFFNYYLVLFQMEHLLL